MITYTAETPIGSFQIRSRQRQLASEQAAVRSERATATFVSLLALLFLAVVVPTFLAIKDYLQRELVHYFEQLLGATLVLTILSGLAIWYLRYFSAYYNELTQQLLDLELQIKRLRVLQQRQRQP